MKSNKTLLFTGIIAILLSSCGSLSIGTKRYSRGLNISWFSGKDDEKQKSDKPVDKRKTELASKPVQNKEIEQTITDDIEMIEDNSIIIQNETQSELSTKKTDINKTSESSVRQSKSMNVETKTEKKQNSLLKKIDKKIQKLSPKSSTETHESSGLSVIGWILIILGLLLLLFASILLGLLLMLLGLLFILVGR